MALQTPRSLPPSSFSAIFSSKHASPLTPQVLSATRLITYQKFLGCKLSHPIFSFLAFLIASCMVPAFLSFRFVFSIGSAILPFWERIRSLRALWAGCCTHILFYWTATVHATLITHVHDLHASCTRLTFGVHWTRHAVVDTGVYRRNDNVEVVGIFTITSVISFHLGDVKLFWMTLGF
jgi:hypothetical protein